MEKLIASRLNSLCRFPILLTFPLLCIQRNVGAAEAQHRLLKRRSRGSSSIAGGSAEAVGGGVRMQKTRPMKGWFRLLAVLSLATSPMWGWQLPFSSSAALSHHAQSQHNAPAQGEKQPFPSSMTPEQQAWQMLEAACHGDDLGRRLTATRVLGLMRHDARAVPLAEHSLHDQNPRVRAAAATALGELGASSAIHELRAELTDSDPSVVLAAAHALVLFHDEAGYRVYHEVLTGERSTRRSLFANEAAKLTNPRQLAALGFTQGLSFVPFASIGWNAFKAIQKGDPTPGRAAAAKVLANDPDRKTTEALEKATGDDHWLVRVAALEALAMRGDPRAAATAAAHLSDQDQAARYTAAAALLELRALSHPTHEPAKDSGGTKR